MKYQAEHAVPPQIEVFNATMADKTNARSTILDFEEVNIASSKFRHKAIINLVKFSYNDGKRVSYARDVNQGSQS